MSNKPQKKVYESIDIISEEMARQIVHENKHKLSNADGSEFFEMNFQNEEDKENIEIEKIRNNKKKWTITKGIIFNKLKEKSNKINFDIIKDDEMSEEKEEKMNNPLYNVQISSIKSKNERKNEKFSSFKKNNINNTLTNKNIEEEKSTKTKEKNILVLNSDGNSNSSEIDEKESENKNDKNNIINNNENTNNNQKENKLINENNNEEKINDIVNKEMKKRVLKNPPRRRSLEPKLIFPLRKTKTTVDLDSESSANKSKSSESEKDDENSSKKIEKQKASLKDSLTSSEKYNKRKVKFNTNYLIKKQNLPLDSENFISPFSSEDEIDFSVEKKPKTITKLQKKTLKNMIVYRPKFTAKHFYEHEMFLKKRKERINNSKKIKQELKEEENNKLIPTIDSFSNKLILQNESYIPIMKKSIEYRNQRNFRNMLNERLNEKGKKKVNNTVNLDKSKVDLIYWRQQFWRKKVEEKLNKSSYKKQKLEKEQKEKNYKNYKLQLCSYSIKLIENKTKYFNTINNNISVFDRLYQDSKSHEKKIKNLTSSYYNTLFKPNINHSFTLAKRNINNQKPIKYYKTTYNNNTKKKKNNIMIKNKKKKLSFIFEEINIQKNKSRNIICKNENLTTIDSTKTSKNANNTLKQRISIESDNIKNIKSKIIQTKSKEISSMSNKLGEIKEADSVLSEASMKDMKIKQNKSIKINDINNTEKNYNINQLTNKDSNKEKAENNIKDSSLSSEKIEGVMSNNVNNSNNSPNQKKSLSLIKQNSLKNINSNITKNSKEIKQKESFTQKNNEINSNDSPSFNSITKKDKKQNISLNKSKSINNSENLLEETHSFGNYNYSNFLSKENITKESKEKDPNIKQKSPKNNIKKNEFQQENGINKQELHKNNFKKQIININFNPYENEINPEKSKDTITSEESSSSDIKKEIDDDDNLLQKIRNIEMKEERKKIDKIIEGNKNKNKMEEEKNENDLYMLNWRNNVANAIQEPFCYKDTKGIFYKFFKKN